MRILLTGFEPFGGEKINSSYEAVKLLPDNIAGAEIIKLQIPTSFSRCALAVENGIIAYNPDVVLNIGEAGGRACVTVERVAINLAETVIPDNDGDMPSGEPLQTGGPAAYFATVPVKEIVNYVRQRGIPCQISYSAGAYVCNCVMYRVLHMADVRYRNIRAGFIHVPYIHEQVKDRDRGTPSMSLSVIANALEFAIEAVIEKC